jgi:hypothetical protein
MVSKVPKAFSPQTGCKTSHKRRARTYKYTINARKTGKKAFGTLDTMFRLFCFAGVIEWVYFRGG